MLRSPRITRLALLTGVILTWWASQPQTIAATLNVLYRTSVHTAIRSPCLNLAARLTLICCQVVKGAAANPTLNSILPHREWPHRSTPLCCRTDVFYY